MFVAKKSERKIAKSAENVRFTRSYNKNLFQDLRTFARKFSNIDFFLKILPVNDDELVISEMLKKMGGHRLRFRKNMPGRTPKSE